jgi:hypothetical protein
MTVSTTENRISYSGNAVTTAFDFPYKFLATSDLKVYVDDVLMVLTTDYSVGSPSDDGASVTFVVAPAIGSNNIVILRDPDLLQQSDLPSNGPFPSSTVEKMSDKLTLIVQRLTELMTRSFSLSDSDTSGADTTLPSPESNTVIGWNEDANALQNVSLTTLATVVAFGTANSDVFDGDGVTTVFLLSGNPAALNNLDISIGGVTQTPVNDYTWSGGNALTFTTAPPSGTDNILVRYMQGLPISDVQSSAWIQSGTGAIQRTVGDKLQESISVKDYGAISGGVTDDTTAIQDAIDYASSLPYGGIVDGLGLTYAISSRINLGGENAVRLQNIKLVAIGVWGTGDAGIMLEVTRPTASLIIPTNNLNSGSNIKLFCNRLAGSGLRLNNAGSVKFNDVYVHGFLEYGVWAKAAGDGLNDAVLTNVISQEYSWSNGTTIAPGDYLGYSDYSYRTGIALYLDNVADMAFINVTGALSLNAIKFEGICFSNKFIACTLWGNRNAIGASSAAIMSIPYDTSHGGQFIGCRFDDSPIELRGHEQTFSGCRFIQTNPAIKLIATVASSDGEGLTVSGCEFTGSSTPITYVTEGAGSWVTPNLMRCTVAANSSLQTDTIIGSDRELRYRQSERTDGLVRGDLQFQGINSRTHSYQHHGSDFGLGFSASKWGANTDYASVQLAKSRSATVGTFGGYPSSGDVLGLFGATGDRGANFGNGTFPLSGAYAQVKATALWSAGGYPCQWEFATTPAAGTGNATARIVINPDGMLAPFVTNSYDLGVTGSLSWRNIYSQNALTVTSDERTKTDIAPSVLGLDFIMDLNPVSYKFIVGGNTHTQLLEKDAVLDDEGAVIEEAVFTDVITPTAGVRSHYGLIAQEVQAVALKYNVDFGGHVIADMNDADSLQMLRYEEFIAPLIKAVQELGAEVELLKTKVNQ